MLKFSGLDRKIHCLNKIQSVKTINELFRRVQSSEYKRSTIKKFAMHRKWKPDLFKVKTNICAIDLQNYKLLSYNILAQDLLVEHLHLYYDIDNKMLQWENRLTKLTEEIAVIEPDIMCLQEMQHDHLKELVNQFSIALKRNRRLEYVFKKKTGNRSDGCVIIYDRNKFKLISEHFVEYYTESVPTLNRENIGLMAKLHPLDDNSMTFVVATTHLLYNPKREDVRISQVNKLIQAVIEFSEISESINEKNHAPVIITGDFNFTPNTHAFEILTGLRKPIIKSERTHDVEHLQNEYFFQMHAIDFGMVNAASTYQNQWITVDYILKSRSQRNSKSIQVKSIYKLPSKDQCWKNGKIPNKFVGSDHFSLAIKFSVI